MDPREIGVAARNIALLEGLRPVLAEWARAGRPAVLLKGCALLFSLYARQFHRRPMADLDLLVHPRHLAAAGALLEQHGFRHARSGDPVYERRSGLHLTVDLHPGLDYLDGNGLEALLARARPVAGGAYPALTLDPTDEVLYLAWHAIARKGEREGSRIDELASLLRHRGDPAPDTAGQAAPWSWDRLVQRALEAGPAPARVAGMALESLVRRGIEVPPAVLDRLRPPRDTLDRVLGLLLDAGPVLDTGHLLRVVLAPDGRSRWRLFLRQLFPDRGFLRRRYGVREGEEIYWLLRPMSWTLRGGRVLRALAGAWWRKRRGTSAGG